MLTIAGIIVSFECRGQAVERIYIFFLKKKPYSICKTISEKLKKKNVLDEV